MTQFTLSSGCLSILFWPFVTLWTIVTTVIKLAGRFVLLIVGLLLMIAGTVLTITLVGAVIGVPLAMLGLLLIVRALF